MMSLYNHTSAACSALIMNAYSTSFSFGTRILHKRFREPICAIYGFVRLADEIVDTFHAHDKRALLRDFRLDAQKAIDQEISLNPVLNAFQNTVYQYNIDLKLIRAFLDSMEMDLDFDRYNKRLYNEYIYGSAEVVGLMCLQVFCEGNRQQYEQLKPAACKLGAAFQKVNFLRDMQADYVERGRLYFPGINFSSFNDSMKREIEQEIWNDFQQAREGIRNLPYGARLDVYLSYRYYLSLFFKIQRCSIQQVKAARIRVSSANKFILFLQSYVQNQLNII
jgi:phytoene synthase